MKTSISIQGEVNSVMHNNPLQPVRSYTCKPNNGVCNFVVDRKYFVVGGGIVWVVGALDGLKFCHPKSCEMPDAPISV